ncbi:MAG TPA: alpha/beta hydrolase, partial [Aliiroseovarius sp.]|nr:alpha/beta hydrolase [Aliiroseovarius sp.]
SSDPTPPEAVTLAAYARAIVAALTPDTILLGHSMGGYPVTLAAEAVAPRALIYLTAYTPWPGKSIADMGRLGGHHTMAGMAEMALNRRSFTYRAEVADKFYHDCSEAARSEALARLTPQAVAPLTTAITPHRALTLTRHYITCLPDRAITPDQQAEMAARFPAANRHEIDTGHSPFLAAPARLAQILHEIAEGS